MIIDTYCLVFTLRLIVRLTKIKFLIERLIAIKNFNRTAALLKTKPQSHQKQLINAINITPYHSLYKHGQQIYKSLTLPGHSE